jgi:hypothetical protein
MFFLVSVLKLKKSIIEYLDTAIIMEPTVILNLSETSSGVEIRVLCCFLRIKSNLVSR